MKLQAIAVALLGAIVAISGAFGSNVQFQASRRLQQSSGVRTAARTQVCDGSSCTTTDEDGVVVSGAQGETEAKCLENCASLTAGQIECIQACTSGDDATLTPTSSGSSGSTRSVSCVNGKCTVEECDASGKCTIEELDSEDAGTDFPSGGSGMTPSNGSTSSSATVTASSGPGGVDTDVQTSGTGARGSATASNGTVTEMTSCDGVECETTTTPGAAPTDTGDGDVEAGEVPTGDGGGTTDGEVQNNMSDGGVVDSGDGGEVTTEPEAVDTSGDGTPRGVATGVLLALMAGAALLGM